MEQMKKYFYMNMNGQEKVFLISLTRTNIPLTKRSVVFYVITENTAETLSAVLYNGL